MGSGRASPKGWPLSCDVKSKKGRKEHYRQREFVKRVLGDRYYYSYFTDEETGSTLG